MNQNYFMKLVILGGGFAGLRLARKLSNQKGIDVTLVDKFNYHQFQPLFYQVATAGLDASNISFPLRKVFQKADNVHVRLAEVQQIVPDKNIVITNNGEIDYDVLVLATGASTNFFGNENIAKNAFPMKSTVDALQIRHRLLQNLEDALYVKTPEELERLMTIVVVGGGPTGVEVSGAIADMRNFVLPKDYPELDFKKMKIYLIESSPKTLGVMSEKSSKQSQEYLTELGVIVKTGTQVSDYDGKKVTLKTGATIPTATVIWGAGVKANVPEGADKATAVRGGRLKVDRYNKVVGYENIYAVGDISSMETPLYPNGHPQLASVAIQQAKNLAKNFISFAKKGSFEKEFEYVDKGSMATIGRNLAVVDLATPKVHFKGLLAWMVWMFLHLMLILGVKNRFFVFINWLYNYVTYDQSLRLIFNEFERPKDPVEQPVAVHEAASR
ncbi:NAD(P)/FAD-dependent oxidoreductase [Parasegetibacter sp. MAH-26]|uniref:NADH:ubiquinone reductase (non-electrogenic) n=2 Tax=Pinibacter aurantiacus TaxID=2851599 RepID=A0A9E2SFG9_9BACT|nr:NAD(P)/FAD-dependent oxidoreductase [Pinibacter aurantiacus]